MTPRVDKRVVDGEVQYACAVCGDVLVRIEENGILGQELNDLDALVVSDHFLSKHSRP